MKLTVFTDGASRGNPGAASYGFVITDEHGGLVYEEGKTIGVTTNNVAEYTSVLQSLKYIKKNYKGRVAVQYFADSRLVVEQLSGRFKVKSAHLRELILQINMLINGIGEVSFNHVPREKNKDADALANLALDGKPT